MRASIRSRATFDRMGAFATFARAAIAVAPGALALACGSGETDEECCPEIHLGRGLSASVGGGAETRAALSTLLKLADTAEATALRVNEACRQLVEANGAASFEGTSCDAAVESLRSARALGIQVTLAAPRCRLSVIDYEACSAEHRGDRGPRDGCTTVAPLTCREGSFFRRCDGRCEGGPSVSCEGRCDGACAGACTARGVACNGACDGTCTATEPGGGWQPDGQCLGACTGTCAVLRSGAQCDGACSGTCVGTCVGTPAEPVGCDGTCSGSSTPLTCDGTAIRGGCETREDPSVVCDVATARVARCDRTTVRVTANPLSDPTRTRPIADAIASPLAILLEERARLRLLVNALEPYLAYVMGRHDYVPRCAPTVEDATVHVRRVLTESLAASETALRDDR